MKKKYDFAIVSGGFDPVHVGHLRMFQDAKKIADKVILLLNNCLLYTSDAADE